MASVIETYTCKAERCSNPHTHTTPGHKCPHCDLFGHGGLECGDMEKIDRLPKRSDGSWIYDIHPGVMMPYEQQCYIAGCQYKWSHSTEYHKCSNCGFTHHSTECIITNDTDWGVQFQEEYDGISYDLRDNNNIYVVFADSNAEFRVIRKKDNLLNILKMNAISWLNPDHTQIFNNFIEGLYNIHPDILTTIIDNIYVIDVSGLELNDSEDEDDDDEDVYDNDIQCPLCRTINKKDDIKPVKGSGDKCAVCYEKSVEHYFPTCHHACVCDSCFNRL